MLDGIIVYDIVDGPIDSEHFLKFIKELVILLSVFLYHAMGY